MDEVKMDVYEEAIYDEGYRKGYLIGYQDAIKGVFPNLYVQHTDGVSRQVISLKAIRIGPNGEIIIPIDTKTSQVSREYLDRMDERERET